MRDACRPDCIGSRPSRVKLAAATLVPVVFLASGCGDGDDEKPEGPNPSLRDADDVEEGQAAEVADEVEVGEFGDLTADTRVSVTAMQVGGDDLGPWLEVSVRFENASDDVAYIPDAGIVCAGSVEQGGYQAGSTVSLGEEVPRGSFKEGVLNLMVPGDSRTGEVVPPCAGPAFVQFTGEDPETFEEQVVRVPIAADVLADLEAAYEKAG